MSNKKVYYCLKELIQTIFKQFLTKNILILNDNLYIEKIIENYIDEYTSRYSNLFWSIMFLIFH